MRRSDGELPLQPVAGEDVVDEAARVWPDNVRYMLRTRKLPESKMPAQERMPSPQDADIIFSPEFVRLRAGPQRAGLREKSNRRVKRLRRELILGRQKHTLDTPHHDLNAGCGSLQMRD